MVGDDHGGCGRGYFGHECQLLEMGLGAILMLQRGLDCFLSQEAPSRTARATAGIRLHFGAGYGSIFLGDMHE